MTGEELGIVIDKAELALLLAHTEKESKTLDCVAFSADTDAVRAFATDGKCAVAGYGLNNGLLTTDGERQWRVLLPFLEAVKKAMGSKDFARLEFSGASLTEAVILELLEDDAEPVLEERQTARWHEDAVDQQGVFPFAGAAAACKKLSNDRGVPQTLAPRFVKRLGLMSALSTNGVEIRSGKSASDGVMAIATTSDATEWVCRIMPCGEDAKEAAKEAVERLRDSCAPLELVTTRKPRSKAGKSDE